MTEQQVQSIIDSAKDYLEELNYNERDVTLSLIYINLILDTLSQPFLIRITHDSIFLINNDIPLDDKRFPELLRVMANMLELKYEIEGDK